MPWETRSTREVYANRWIRVTEDEVLRPDGGEGIYGVVEVVSPAVFVVPVTDDDRVVLVRVERYTTGTSWEVPAGGSEGQDLRAAAERELVEETGCTAARWQHLGGQWSLNGVARARCEVFLARGLTRASDRVDEGEGIVEVGAFTWPEVRELLRSGQLDDGESAGALLRAAVELGWA